MSQKLILNNLIQYLRLHNHTKQTNDILKKLLADLESGHCFGFTACHGIMDDEGKLAWWEAALEAIANIHDGSELTDTIQFEIKLRQKVRLPDSDTTQSLNQICERVLHYFIPPHAYGKAIQTHFLPKNIDQSNVLSIKEQYIEYSGTQTIKKVIYYKENRLDPTFSPDLLDAVLDEVALETKICVLSSSYHSIRIGYKKNLWFIYDSNFDHRSVKNMRQFYADKQAFKDAFIASFIDQQIYNFQFFSLNSDEPIIFSKLTHATQKFLHFLNIPITSDLPAALQAIATQRCELLWKESWIEIGMALAKTNHHNETGLHLLCLLAHIDSNIVEDFIVTAFISPENIKLLSSALLTRSYAGRSGLHQLTECLPQLANRCFIKIIKEDIASANFITVLGQTNPISNFLELTDILLMQSESDEEYWHTLLSLLNSTEDGKILTANAFKDSLKLGKTPIINYPTPNLDILDNLLDIALSTSAGTKIITNILGETHSPNENTLCALANEKDFSAVSLLIKISRAPDGQKHLTDFFMKEGARLIKDFMDNLEDDECCEFIKLLSSLEAIRELLATALISKNKFKKTGIDTLDMHTSSTLRDILPLTIHTSQNSIVAISALECCDERTVALAIQMLPTILKNIGDNHIRATKLIKGLNKIHRLGSSGIHSVLQHIPTVFPDILAVIHLQTHDESDWLKEILDKLCEYDSNHLLGWSLLHAANKNYIKDFFSFIKSSDHISEMLFNFLIRPNLKSSNNNFQTLLLEAPEILLQLLEQIEKCDPAENIRELLEEKYIQAQPSLFPNRSTGLDLLEKNAPNIAAKFRHYAPHTSNDPDSPPHSAVAVAEDSSDSEISVNLEGISIQLSTQS